jgi:hypothetical protein
MKSLLESLEAVKGTDAEAETLEEAYSLDDELNDQVIRFRNALYVLINRNIDDQFMKVGIDLMKIEKGLQALDSDMLEPNT